MKRHAAKCVWRHPPGDEVSMRATASIEKANILNYSRFDRSTGRESSVCGKWTESGKSNTANIYVCWQSSFSTTRHSTTMSNHFYFM